MEAFGDFGRVVRGIAADPDGGCFAVGYASGRKDLDVIEHIPLTSPPQRPLRAAMRQAELLGLRL